jgi:predicted DNA-binding transcriptional regulator YafY
LRAAATETAPVGEGWDLVRLPYVDAGRLADQVLPYGADAVVVAPDEVREVVVRRLRALAEARS